MPVERLTVCPLCNDTKLVWRGSPERGDWEDCDCVTKGDAWVDAFPRIATGKQLDRWAEHVGVPPRQIVAEGEPHTIDPRTGMRVLTDEAFRRRILAKLQPVVERQRDAVLREEAERIVNEWREAHNKTLLSPVQCADLVNRIIDAMNWAMEWVRSRR